MSNEKQVKQELEDRGRAVGIEVDKRNSVDELIAEVEAAEMAAEQADLGVEADAEFAKQEAANTKSHIIDCDAVTTMRGIMVKGDPCEARDFTGGEDQLAEMTIKGLVKKA